jgi:hypothetical protein
MFILKNIVKALRGEESLLLLLPKEVGTELNIANQDLLKFEIKDKQQLLITKVLEE